MKLRIFVWILLVFAAALVLLGAESLLMQQDLADKTLRLHVVANSDSPEDQAQKLRVRDEILREVSRLTAHCTTAEEAELVLSSHLSELSEKAEDFLRQEGSAYSVEALLTVESFSTRHYDSFSLPAGTYPALRVNIGAAAGKNWWCVVFPSLCTAATGEAMEEAAQAGGYSDGEYRLITGG
jgi:stage II sporulation protein R